MHINRGSSTDLSGSSNRTKETFTSNRLQNAMDLSGSSKMFATGRGAGGELTHSISPNAVQSASPLRSSQSPEMKGSLALRQLLQVRNCDTSNLMSLHGCQPTSAIYHHRSLTPLRSCLMPLRLCLMLQALCPTPCSGNSRREELTRRATSAAHPAAHDQRASVRQTLPSVCFVTSCAGTRRRLQCRRLLRGRASMIPCATIGSSS
jgi:hypothetical protein